MKRLIGILSITSLSLMFFTAYSQQLDTVDPDSVYQGTSEWLEIEGVQTHFTDITATNQIELRRFFNRIYPDSFIVKSDTKVKIGRASCRERV